MRIDWLAAVAAAFALALPATVAAQPPGEQMPALTAEQATQVQQQMAVERRAMEARVARGEATPDEAERFLGWREWQIARQVAGLAPPPPAVTSAQPPAVAYPPRYIYGPAPHYAPAPYYWGPRYYWGASICAGGWGDHGGARICF
jgi:hypothetical protein